MNFHKTTQDVAKAIDPYARKKYRPGPVLKTFEQVLDAAQRGVWIFYNHKAYHPSWALNWSLWRTKQALAAGNIRIGIRNKAFPLVFEAIWTGSKAEPRPNSDSYYMTCSELPGYHSQALDAEIVFHRAYEVARKHGHFGEVDVKFQKECPF
jgi:hypothetical protein